MLRERFGPFLGGADLFDPADHYLGVAGGGSTTLTLNLLPGVAYQLNFQLFIIDDWEADNFSVTVNSASLLDTTFSNAYPGSGPTMQGYGGPGAISGSYWPGTGSTTAYNIDNDWHVLIPGEPSSYTIADSVYSMSFVFTPTAKTTTIAFSSGSTPAGPDPWPGTDVDASGRFGLDNISLLPIPKTPNCPTCSGDDVATEATNSTGGDPAADSTSSDTGVNFGNGGFTISSDDSSSDGVMAWDQARMYSNQGSAGTPGSDSAYSNGNSWTDLGLPYLLKTESFNSDGSVNEYIMAEVFDAGDVRWFTSSDDVNFSSDTLLQDQLTDDGSGYELLDSNGGVTQFGYFDSDTEIGGFGSYTDANGNTSSVTSLTSDGLPAEIQQSSGSTVDSYLYGYTDDQITSIIQRNSTDGGDTWNYGNEVDYAYAATAGTGANVGDLVSATTLVGSATPGSGAIIGVTQYIYYTPSDAAYSADVDDLQYVIGPAAYVKMEAADLDPTSPSDAVLYANAYYQYDAQNRVTSVTLAGAGSAAATSGTGQGTYTYSYDDLGPPTGSEDPYNTAVMKTTETRPNGTVNQVYTSYYGEVTEDVLGGLTTLYTYNSTGCETDVVDPSGLDTHYVYDGGYLSEIDQEEGTNFAPIESWAYDTQTTASGSSITLVASDTVYAGPGYSGAQTTSYSYGFVGDGTSDPTTQLAWETITQPENEFGVSPQTTEYFDASGRVIWAQDPNGNISYTQYDPATGAVVKQIQDVKTADTSEFSDLPSGWSTPSGGGLNLVTTNYVDAKGRTLEQISPAGNITLYEYDDSDHATFTIPGVILDAEDGTLETTGPIVMTHDDIPYGYSQTFYTLVGESYTGTVETLEGLYNEVLTFSSNDPINYSGGTDGEPVVAAMPDFVEGGDSGPPPPNLLNFNVLDVSCSPEFTIQSLTRDLNNSSGQMMESDTYAQIDDSTYMDTAVGDAYSVSGTPYYYPTYHDYDAAGLQSQTIDPNGTIYDTVYDALGRVASQWVGTDDQTGWSSCDPSAPSYFYGTNPGTDNNMTEVESEVYNDAGNVTETIQYPDGSVTGTQDVSLMSYDFQNRLIATETGLTLNSEGAAVTSGNDSYPQITVRTLDGVGNVLATLSFNGGATTMGDAISAAGSAGPGESLTGLVGYSTSAYDSMNEDYQDQTFSVDPAGGTISETALTALSYYDADGNAIESIAPTGLVTKDVYDGADRLIDSFITDGGAVGNDGSPVVPESYSDASSVFSDVVIQQTAYGYDADGNVIETVSAQRSSGDPASTEGALFTYTVNSDGSLDVTAASGDDSSLAATIDYDASYYDAADRDIADVSVGDDGGSAWSRPSDVPSDSSTVLVTGYGYDVAGNQDTVTDPKGIVTQSDFDNMGRVVTKIADYTDGTPTADSNQTTAYTYDGLGDLTSMTAVMPSGTPDQTTDYLYGVTTSGGSKLDSNDLLGEIYYPDPGSGDASGLYAQAYQYDALGEATSITDQNGTKHVYAYDTAGREISDTATVASGNPYHIDTTVAKLVYSFNSQGLPYQQTSYNSSGGVVNQVEDLYNGLGQLTDQYQSVSGRGGHIDHAGG